MTIPRRKGCFSLKMSTIFKSVIILSLCQCLLSFSGRFNFEVYENSVILRGIDFGILNTIDNTYITETHVVPTGLLLLKTT